MAGRAGLLLDDWQAWVLEQGLGELPDGDWAAFEAAVVVPRQNGKGAIIEALCLAGLFLFEDRLTIYSAHEFKTAQETYRRIDELIAGSSWLSKRVVRRVQSTNESGFELDNGCRLRFLARSKGSGRGFSSRRLIFDEAYDLPATAMGAVMPTLSAQPNPQIWYFSSAGQGDSDVLRNLRRRGLEGSSRLMFAEWSAPDGADPTDMDAIAVANPGLGIRISEQFIRDEQAALDPAEFAREVMGVWDEPVGSSGVIPFDAWAARGAALAVPGDPVVFGLDCSPNLGSAALVACGPGRDGLPVVEVVEHNPGIAWVLPWLNERIARYDVLTLGVDPSGPVGALMPELERLPIRLVQFDGRQVSQACTSFISSVIEGRVWHRDDERLTSAVLNAELRASGDSARLSRKNSRIDICQFIAATNALWLHTSTVDVAESFW